MSSEPLVRWDWLAAHLGPIAGRIEQHLYLTLIAVSVGFAISFLLATVAIRRRRLYPLIVVVTTGVYTIPSFALFAALIVFSGPSVLSAEVPLIMYTLVLFVPNIVAGFDAVPWDVLDSADGMGYTPGQRW